ncbi:MAG: alpha-L-fucosidase [Cellvibrionaceae bacterium]|nr:alpha-L-fucosidase [Cellvibrionaceae bacterium]
MNSNRRQFILGTATGSAFCMGLSACGKINNILSAPDIQPEGAVPSKRQLAWQRVETYGFLHFSINTFTDREWGYGDEKPRVFNPTEFSAPQIVASAKAGGLKALILTAKHHDGFCLWPSKYTEHSVKNCPYKNGAGDIVGEIASACQQQGLKFGVYLSPWDRNHAEYGRPAYVEYYHKQLEELTTQYGPLFEVWFDGANGGDGYYGGASERRKIDAVTYYQWDKVRAIVRKNQPDAVMFADEHMDVRWVGNEHGVAGDPCWPTVDDTPYTMAKGNRGVRGGAIWNPAETNTSIRPGWFWHRDEDSKVRSPANLLRLYMTSVARGTNLLLNIPPDRRGLVHEADVASLTGFKAILDQAFAKDLAQGATASASSNHGSEYSAENIFVDNKYWAAKADERQGAWLQLDLNSQQTFDFIRLREVLNYGIRVDDFVLEIMTAQGWQTVAAHTSIGHQRIIRLEQAVSAQQVRLRILNASAAPVISDFNLFLLPNIVEEPTISRSAEGSVELRSADEGTQLLYSIDGSPPALNYTGPIALLSGGTVKAQAVKANTRSAITTADFDVSTLHWKILSPADKNAAVLLQGLSGWNAPAYTSELGQPIELVIDLAQSYSLKGFTLRPAAQNPYNAGPPANYSAWVSDKPDRWHSVAESGEFSNIAANRGEQRIKFSQTHTGRYLKLSLPRAVADLKQIAVGGIGIITR